VLTVASPADEWLHLEAVCGETIGQYVHSGERVSHFVVDNKGKIGVAQYDGNRCSARGSKRAAGRPAGADLQPALAAGPAAGR
jgi:hypothetical protein